MPDGALRQTRLIVVDERHDVSAWDVAVVDRGESGGVEIQPDVEDLAGWNRGPNRAAVQQIRKREVVDVPRGAGDLVDALLAKHVAADRGARGHRARLCCFFQAPGNDGDHGGFVIARDRDALHVGVEDRGMNVALARHGFGVAEALRHLVAQVGASQINSLKLRTRQVRLPASRLVGHKPFQVQF
jgi:hypothetical protein